MLLRLLVGPRCEDAQDVGFLPLGKGRLGWLNATGSTMQMLKQDLRKGGGASLTILGNEINRLVTELLQCTRSLVVAAPNRCCSQHRDGFEVGLRLNQIIDWRSKFSERLDASFPLVKRSRVAEGDLSRGH